MSEEETVRPVSYDDNQPFDVHAHSGRYAMRKLIFTLLALLGLALLIFFVYQPGKRNRHDPVVISPDAKALKDMPADKAAEYAADPEIYSAGQGDRFPSTVEVREAPIGQAEPMEIKTPQLSVPVVVPPKITQVEPPVVITPPTPKPQPATPQPVFNSEHVVQVASLKSYAEAQRSWKEMSQKHTFLQGRTYDILQVDLGAKGIFYRLRADGFANKTQASAFCNRLKANGQSCLVTTR